MLKPIFILLVSGLVGACAQMSRVPPPTLNQSELLKGPPAFRALMGDVSVSGGEVLRLDGAMRRFVDTHVNRKLRPKQRLTQLLDAMQTDGLFSLQYSLLATGTVRETFHKRKANCLAFTLLFVALARDAGLTAHFQVVDVPPMWSIKTGVVIHETHINAVVAIARDQPDVVVDFNFRNVAGYFPRRPVSDGYALALFYNNNGAKALLAGRYRASFLDLRQAIWTQPDVASLWTNLGLLYSRVGWHEGARSAYLQALNIDPMSSSAINNLVALYIRSGRQRLAERYALRAEQVRVHNPYYHYFLARRAEKTGRDQLALERVDRAIRIKDNEPRFYRLQAQLLRSLGDKDRARMSLAMLVRYTRSTTPNIPEAASGSGGSSLDGQESGP